MALCSPRACGCAVNSETLEILGSGAAGDPFEIESTTLLRMAGAVVDLADGRLTIAGESSVPTLNGSGVGVVNYGVTFLSSPLVVGVGGDPAIPLQINIVTPPGTTSFSFIARNNVGTLYTSVPVRINWIAIGLVT